ncbi:phage holin family protein [Chengkuizengella axinellae]|uniref:Holin family protein n=1 Tax=Chengkuizengella axinellae TaxID=3064388 RepID=A0ABT9IYQ8_9BACL|nr:holin family protein [Chengkuizengella sp. 2205SS18-9]MDP5274363.1 holin family protein [Chengkuizengella sp. 2205SS18-9]
MESTIFKTIIATLGSIGSYLFGGLDTLLEVLVIFVLIDFLSGLIAGGLEGGLKSKKGFKGIARKIMIFIMVAAAHLTDRAIGDQHLIRDAAIFLYLGNELLSIVENAGRIGIPVPSILMNAVEIFKNKSGKEEK